MVRGRRRKTARLTSAAKRNLFKAQISRIGFREPRTIGRSTPWRTARARVTRAYGFARFRGRRR